MRDPLNLHAPDEAAEIEQVRLKEARRKELEDIKWLMAHPQGRRVSRRLLAEAGVFRSSFHHSGSVMAFNEGKRHVGLWLTGELMEGSSEGYFKLLKENQGNE